MNAKSGGLRQASALALAERLYPDTELPAASGPASRARRRKGLNAPLTRPRQGGALWRLLRRSAAWFAALRERWAVLDELTMMSDRELADIGLSRGQIPCVFDPEFTRARPAPRRAAGDWGDAGGRPAATARTKGD